MRFGQHLKHQSIITNDELEKALRAQATRGGRLATNVVELDIADSATVAAALGRHLGVGAATERHFAQVTSSVTSLVPSYLVQRHRAIPLGMSSASGERKLVVAFMDPTDEAADAVAGITGMKVERFVALEQDIRRYAAELYHVDLPRTPARKARPLTSDIAAVAAPRGDTGPGTADTPPPASVPASAQPPPEHLQPATGPRPALGEPVATRSSKRGITWQEFAAERPTRDGDSTMRIIGGVLFVGALILAVVYGRRMLRGDTARDVSGYHVSEHLDLEITFPEGWRYAASLDQSERPPQMEVRGSFYYRGGSASLPTLGFFISRVDTIANINPRTITDAQFTAMLESARDSMNGPQAGAVLAMGPCQTEPIADRRTGICRGTATADDLTRDVVAYFWLEEGNIVLYCGFMLTDPEAEVRDEMLGIVTSIAPVWAEPEAGTKAEAEAEPVTAPGD